MKCLLLLFIMAVFVSCSTFQGHVVTFPSNAVKLSQCDLTSTFEIPDHPVIFSGKVTSFAGEASFELRCHHNPKKIVIIDQYNSLSKVENSGVFITTYGKLERNRAGSFILIAEDISIDGREQTVQKNSTYYGSGGGNGACH